MLTLPPALDWPRQQFIGIRVIWDATIYRTYNDPPVMHPSPPPIDTEWHGLPFGEGQVDKFPQRSGLYAFTYKYSCLGFPEQDMVMYIGEAGNLRTRLKQHFETSQKGPPATSLERPLRGSDERLRHLFSTFEGLIVRYRVINATPKERRALERALISLLDPPFNWQHRPKPTGVPAVGPTGPIPVKEGKLTSAFVR